MPEDGAVSEASEPRYLRILKNLDALGCTLIAKRAKVGEYISTYVWRVRKGWAIRFIDWLFREPGHCEASFEGQKEKLELVRDEPEEGGLPALPPGLEV